MDRVGYKPRDDVEYARDAALGVIRRQFEFRECFGKKGKGFQATVEDFNEFKRERSLMMVLPEGEEWVHDWAGIRYEPDSALKDLWYMFHPHILFDPSVDYRQWADNLQKLDRMRIWASMYRGSGQDALGVYWDQHVRAHKLARRIKELLEASDDKVQLYLLDGHGSITLALVDALMSMDIDPDDERLVITLVDFDEDNDRFHRLLFSDKRCIKGNIYEIKKLPVLRGRTIFYLNFCGCPPAKGEAKRGGYAKEDCIDFLCKVLGDPFQCDVFITVKVTPSSYEFVASHQSERDHQYHLSSQGMMTTLRTRPFNATFVSQRSSLGRTGDAMRTNSFNIVCQGMVSVWCAKQPGFSYEQLLQQKEEQEERMFLSDACPFSAREFTLWRQTRKLEEKFSEKKPENLVRLSNKADKAQVKNLRKLKARQNEKAEFARDCRESQIRMSRRQKERKLEDELEKEREDSKRKLEAAKHENEDEFKDGLVRLLVRHELNPKKAPKQAVAGAGPSDVGSRPHSDDDDDDDDSDDDVAQAHVRVRSGRVGEMRAVSRKRTRAYNPAAAAAGAGPSDLG